MHKIVKDAFLIIMMAFLAWTLYIVFFGNETNWQGQTMEGGIWSAGGNQWEGVLYYAAREIENPIAKYYFDYCYIPSAHNTDYLDIELGARVYGKSSVSAITYNDYKSSSLASIDYISYPSSGHYQVTY